MSSDAIRASQPSFTHGDWVQVYIDPDHDPDVESRGPGYIRIEERNGAAGVAILPISQNHVGLVRVYRRAIDEISMEIPRGFGGEGTGPRSDAVRELREETGLETSEDALIDLGLIYANSGLLAGGVALFVAFFPDPIDSSGADTKEVQAFGWHPLGAVMQQIGKDSLRDSFTHAALLRAGILGHISLLL